MDSSPLIFFSLEDARNLVAERDRLLRQYEELNRKVEALAVLVPDHMRDKIFGARSVTGSNSVNGHSSAHGNGVALPAAPPPPSLADAIVEMLDDCLEVMTQDQIEEAVWDIPDFSDKDKYPVEEIAKALEKISRRGRATKRGMNYLSKQVTSDNLLGYSGTTIVEAAEKVLREANESLEAWEVIDRLKKGSDVADRVKENTKGVYNALSRLTSRRIAYRDADGGYRIRPK